MSQTDQSTSAVREYGFSARDAKGRRRTGLLNAETHREATRQLRDQGLFPIEINAVNNTSAAKKKRNVFFKPRTSSGRMTARTKASFVGRLAKLVGAKISVDRALKIMSEGEDGAISSCAAALRIHLREGGGFADGLHKTASIDDTATLSLVRSAESSGELDVALATAAGILEQRLMIARRIVTGLLYPSLLLIVSIISVGVIMIAIIPQFQPLVANRMEFVPVLGRAVFALSGTLAAIWPLLLVSFAIVCVVLLWLHKKGRAIPLLLQIIKRVPVVRTLIDRNHAMMSLHILGALLKRGVTLSEALRVVGATTPKGHVRSALAEVSRSVSEGASLAASFAKTKIVEPSAIEMLRIGEETGALEDMASRAATEMREASDRALERFLTLFQPAMIIIVGTLVGVSLYALFSAIIAVNQVAF